VQQITRAGPLVANDLLALSPHRRESRWRQSARWTVECGWPTIPAISRGPQPVRRRSSQIRSCSAAASSFGERCGRLERSRRQASERRSASAAASQRWRHLWAVADETLKSLAAARIDIPASIALQSSWRAASPSFALG
jgi:hypothetical protein